MDTYIPGAFAPDDDAPPEPTPTTQPGPHPDPFPGWTYPTRMCRICREDVVPTITMYPPGLPMKYQRPVVEYKNDDEYGRLIRPCKCRGGMRYIHELCLLRSRTEGVRPGSLWKCPTCGHQFNFKRLSIQRHLGSKSFSGLLTILVMIIIMFMLGFVADPIINLYVDPYDTIVGNEPVWTEVDVATSSSAVSGWSLHFIKGLISMGLVGFLKTAFLNPFNFLNMRGTGFVSTRRTSMSPTGRDRAVNVSWLAVAIGVTSAFYFFYKWVQTLIRHTLQRIGNNVVDTSLPGDDDDLKPPPGWQAKPSGTQQSEQAWQTAEDIRGDSIQDDLNAQPIGSPRNTDSEQDTVLDLRVGDLSTTQTSPEAGDSSSDMQENTPHDEAVASMNTGFSSALDDAQEQGWSFIGVPRQR